MDTQQMTHDQAYGFLMGIDRRLRELTSEFKQIQQDQKRNNAKVRHHLHMIQAHIKSQGTNYTVPVRGNKHVRFSNVPVVRDDSIEADGGISGNESIHRECLQDNFDQLTSTMDLKKTLILDELIQEDCLSQDEAEAIRSKHDRKDQNRKLVVTMSKRSSSKFVSFLEIVQRKSNYPEIAQDLKKCYNEKLSEGRRKSQCLTCGVKRDVSLKDVVDHLFKFRLVDIEFVDLVASDELYSSSNHTHLWESLFSRIDTSSDRLQALQVFKESLVPKYEHIAAKIQLNEELTCHCCQGMVEWDDFQSRLSYPTSTGSSCDVNSESDIDNNATDKRNMDRQTSTSNSIISLEEVNGNTSIPRTLEWLASTGTSESDDPVTPTKISNAYSVIDDDQNSFPHEYDTKSNISQTIGSGDGQKEEKPRSLTEIGNSVMLEAAVQASLKQPQHGVNHTSGNQQNIETTRNENQSSNSKKKKRKRRKHKSEPDDMHRKGDRKTSTASEVLPELNLEMGISGKSSTNSCMQHSNQGTSKEESQTRSIAGQFYQDLKNIKSVTPKTEENNVIPKREHV